MAQIYKPGMKLASAVCKGQVMVLRAPEAALEITCGGLPMLDAEPEMLAPGDESLKAGLLVGKRYVDEGENMEFLCTRAGNGTLCADGTVLKIKQARQLPSSD